MPMAIGMAPTSMVETIHEDSPLAMNEKSRVSRNRSSTRNRAIDEEIIRRQRKATGSRTTSGEKSVHWNPRIGKKRHVHRKDLNKEDRDRIWYNKSDDKLTLATAKVTVKMMMKGQPCDDIDYCSRGLEGKTLIESKKRLKNKRRVLNAVLMEQELQRLEGVKKPEELAKASFKHTKDVSARAYDQGTEDERDVQEYLDDVRTHREDFMKFIKPSAE